METLIYLDTHTAIWLYGGEKKQFKTSTRSYLDNNILLSSPMVFLEMKFLFEVQKIKPTPETIFEKLKSDFGLKLINEDFLAIIQSASGISWTRDPFDRIIVAQASLKSSPLLTRDKAILENYPHAVW